ncbi:hypothetical protein VRU48_12540 [Pedobacter sp. KR3-3]|uniref:Fibronectin type-III domain-containing protein n=1 Tax=Pedobacter albus TaxID=3113905 RepID=A0ABU7I9H5_9SPHI|nr:hypothetical protein [Pedobacter sp. KR3-3]MEE1945941.1 hypothetical protein [Pedobacter sp. KR3-3]
MKYLYLLTITLLLASCGKSNNKSEPAFPPEVAVLLSPLNNEACLSGTNVTATSSTITFSWKPSKYADSYMVSIKNLLTNATTTHVATSTTLQVSLTNNTPYSWSVTSKSSRNPEIQISETWKFHNAGPGIVNYAPFPAEVIFPLPNSTVTATNGKIEFKWKGADADNDVLQYDIYTSSMAGTVFLLKAGHNSTSLISEEPSGKRYWKIVTRDSHGNTSDTGIMEFTVSN